MESIHKKGNVWKLIKNLSQNVQYGRWEWIFLWNMLKRTIKDIRTSWALVPLGCVPHGLGWFIATNLSFASYDQWHDTFFFRSCYNKLSLQQLSSTVSTIHIGTCLKELGMTKQRLEPAREISAMTDLSPKCCNLHVSLQTTPVILISFLSCLCYLQLQIRYSLSQGCRLRLVATPLSAKLILQLVQL